MANDDKARPSWLKSWNHRVMRRAELDGYVYGIVEAHYELRSDTRPHSWTESFVAPIGETPEELEAELKLFTEALSKPILAEDGSECEPK